LYKIFIFVLLSTYSFSFHCDQIKRESVTNVGQVHADSYSVPVVVVLIFFPFSVDICLQIGLLFFVGVGGGRGLL